MLLQVALLAVSRLYVPLILYSFICLWTSFLWIKTFSFIFLFKANYSNRVSHHHLHLAGTQKHAEEQECFTVEKEEGFMYALARGYQPRAAVGEIVGQGTLAGQGCIFDCLQLVLSWKWGVGDEGSGQLCIKSWPFGPLVTGILAS